MTDRTLKLASTRHDVDEHPQDDRADILAHELVQADHRLDAALGRQDLYWATHWKTYRELLVDRRYVVLRRDIKAGRFFTRAS